VLVMMESSRRANPALEESGSKSEPSPRGRDQRGASQLREGRAAASACRRGGRRARDRRHVDGKTDRVLPAEPLAQLRQAHGLIVWDVEDDGFIAATPSARQPLSLLEQPTVANQHCLRDSRRAMTTCVGLSEMMIGAALARCRPRGRVWPGITVLPRTQPGVGWRRLWSPRPCGSLHAVRPPASMELELLHGILRVQIS